MPVYIEFKVDAREHDAARRMLEEFPKKAPKAISRALNKALNKTRTFVKRIVSQETGIKQEDLLPDKNTGRLHRYGGLTTIPSSASDLKARLRITGERIPVFRFGAKPDTPGTRPRGGVTWKIGRQRRHGIKNPSAFIARVPTRREDVFHTGVFRRIGEPIYWNAKQGRRVQKIVELFGPSIPEVAQTSPALEQALNVDIQAELNKALEGQLASLLKHNAYLREAE